MISDPTTPKPYLSVVATARNDDHGGNLIGRMQLFVSGLIEQCNRHGVEAELLLVEWNPPPDKPRLAEVLRWPATCGKCTVRIVEVPPEVHHRLDHADKLPLFQMIGKNVGIRRARGEYVLATNIDILFSDAVFEFLKSGQMKPGFIYRTDRLDVPPEIPCDTPLSRQLEFCRKNVIRRHIFEGSYDCRIRKWVSRRVDAWTWKGRFYAILHRIHMQARTLKNNAGNFRRRTVHRLVMQYRTRRNQVLNRCRWVYHKTRAELINRSRWVYHKTRAELMNRSRSLYHKVRCQYLTTRNNILNRSRWVYHKTRAEFINRSRWLYHKIRLQYLTTRNGILNRSRWVYHKTRALVVNRSRWAYHKVRGQYRSFRNHILNRSRWTYHRLRDCIRRFVHSLRLLLQFAVRLVKSVPRGCVGLVRSTAFWFDVRVLTPLKIRWQGTSLGRFSDRVAHNYPLTYARCAVRVLRDHYRDVARVRVRYTVMCVRDALPKWLDQSSLLPARSTSGCRDERKRALRECLVRLRAIELRARIGTAATRRARRHRRLLMATVDERKRLLAERFVQHRLHVAEVADVKLQRKLERRRQQQALKRKRQRAKQDELRRKKTERAEQKRRQQFQALQRKASEERRRRLAAKRKRKREQQSQLRQKANRPNFKPQHQVGSDRNGFNHGQRREAQHHQGWQPDGIAQQHEYRAPAQELAEQFASPAECATAELERDDADRIFIQGNGSGHEHAEPHAEPADLEIPVQQRAESANELVEEIVSPAECSTAELEKADAECSAVQGNGSGGTEQSPPEAERLDLQTNLHQGPQLPALEIAPLWRRTVSWLANGKPKIPIQRPHLHTYACGDFTMLAKADWEALRGYAEFQMYSMHIDSLFLVAGAHYGLKQRLLGKEAAIYHIEHGLGSGWTPEGEEKLNKRLADAGIPQISYHQYVEYDRQMALSGRADIVNDEQWGFGDISLPETVIP